MTQLSRHKCRYIFLCILRVTNTEQYLGRFVLLMEGTLRSLGRFVQLVCKPVVKQTDSIVPEL